MILLGIDWTNINGGSLAVVASIFVIAGFFYRWAPGASAALETAQASADSFQRLYEGTKAELEVAVADAKRRFDERESEKARAHDLEIKLTKCQEQPKTEDLAAAVKRLADSFETAATASSKDFGMHRSELVAIMSRLADGQTQILRMLERDQETLGSMHQALIVLVDRNRSNRAADAEGRDPPLST